MELRAAARRIQKGHDRQSSLGAHGYGATPTILKNLPLQYSYLASVPLLVVFSISMTTIKVREGTYQKPHCVFCPRVLTLSLCTSRLACALRNIRYANCVQSMTKLIDTPYSVAHAGAVVLSKLQGFSLSTLPCLRNKLGSRTVSFTSRVSRSPDDRQADGSNATGE